MSLATSDDENVDQDTMLYLGDTCSFCNKAEFCEKYDFYNWDKRYTGVICKNCKTPAKTVLSYKYDSLLELLGIDVQKFKKRNDADKYKERFIGFNINYDENGCYDVSDAYHYFFIMVRTHLQYVYKDNVYDIQEDKRIDERNREIHIIIKIFIK